MIRNLRLIKVLTLANLKSRYRNTFYGFLWVVLNPILSYAVQVFAFTTIFQVKTVNYPLYLLAGVLPWLFIVQSVEMCTGLFLYNGTIIKNVPMSPSILVFVQILDNFINFFSAFAILILYFCLFHSLSFLALIYILIPTLSLLIAITSMCLIFAILNVRFRDLRFIVSFVFSLMFYLTPIVYNISLVPERFKVFIENNPLSYLIHPFQEILVSRAEVAMPNGLLQSFAFSIALLVMAKFAWTKSKKYLVFYV